MAYESYEDAYESGYGAGASSTGDILPGINSKSIEGAGIALILFLIYQAFAHPDSIGFEADSYRTIFGGFILYATINLIRYGMYFWYRWRWKQYYKTGSSSFCVRNYRWVGRFYNLIPRNPLYTILALICIFWKRHHMFNSELWAGHTGFYELAGAALAGFLILKVLIFILQAIFGRGNIG